MTASDEKSFKNLAANRKAFRDYFIIERYEAGIELRGTEVKSVRNGHASLAGSYARVDGGEVMLLNMNITPYEFGNQFNHDPVRQRRLLLHKSEINKLKVHTEQKGHTVVPLNVYMKNGIVKIELGLCKGKRQHDKRDTMRRKTADREAERAIARHR